MTAHGSIVERHRKILGLTQTDLANRMTGHRWHQQTVQRVESDDRPLRLTEAFDLAAIFGIQVTEFADPKPVGRYVAEVVFDTDDDDFAFVMDRIADLVGARDNAVIVTARHELGDEVTST